MGDTNDGACANSAAKRVRGESDESPEAKRIRAADLILLDILDDVDSADRSLAVPAAGDLAVVLKSFEEEIAAVSPQQQQQAEGEPSQPPLTTSTSDSDEPRQSDLDYLLEASDDELGLPPTAPSPDKGEAAEGLPVEDGIQGAAGLGQIWGFDDEIPSYYDALGFGGLGLVDDRAAGDAVVFDGGLFGYPDLPDCSWQPESLPAV